MLTMLKQANEYLGLISPHDLQELTPKEYEYMMTGAQQRQLDQWQHDYQMSFITHPVGLVDKNPNDDIIKRHLDKQAEALRNFDNEEYQRQEAAKQKRQKAFSTFFGKFSRQNTNKGG